MNYLYSLLRPLQVPEKVDSGLNAGQGQDAGPWPLLDIALSSCSRSPCPWGLDVCLQNLKFTF